MKKPRKPKLRRKKQRKGAPPRAGRQPAQAALAQPGTTQPDPAPAPVAAAKITPPATARTPPTRLSVTANLPAINAEDRQALALLMAPVMIIAMAIAGQQTITPAHIIGLLAPPAVRIADVQPVTAQRLAPRDLSPSLGSGSLRDRPPQNTQAKAVAHLISPLPPETSQRVKNSLAATTTIPAQRNAQDFAPIPRPAPRRTAVKLAKRNALATHLRDRHPSLAPPLPIRRNSTLPSALNGSRALARLAAPAAPRHHAPPRRLAALAHPPPALDGHDTPANRHTCRAAPAETPMSRALPRDPETFGLRLAEAAYARLADFVIYSDAYRRISYPMGDVPAIYGVCTDLIVRAYRELGVDLQRRVHLARVGSGDRNIDHRRTATLRRFFAKHGTTLPVSTYADDYLPGDIVTYYRPQNRRSRAHIAIVSHKIGPSGRPMIIHNRGWGPQIEDALFVDKITGHYRYAVPALPKIEQATVPVPGTARPTVVKASFTKPASRKSHKLQR